MKNCIFALVLLVMPAMAQQPRQNFVINVGTPEGQMLQQIGQELDDAKKATMMQEFLDKYPKHEGASWVAAMLEADHVGQKEYDKALAVAEKSYANSPDMDVAYGALKAAEAKEDLDEVKKWSARTSEAARKVSAKAPANDDEKQHVEFAKQVDEYSEYALFVQALKAKEPKDTIELVEALEKQDPKSQYLSQAAVTYFGALSKAGDTAKVCPAAVRMSNADPKNAEAMISAADCSWRGNNAAGVISYASKAMQAASSRPKPEGATDADWNTKKQNLVGNANFYVGVGNTMQARYGPANKALRAALGSIRSNDQLYAIALFDLGLANYNLGKSVGDKAQMREGLKFFEQSAGMKSSVQDQASRNATLVRGELGGK